MLRGAGLFAQFECFTFVDVRFYWVFMMDETVQIATVSWYLKKGYGFVTIGDSEIFLHRSALDRFGLSTVYETDKLHLTVTSNQRGDVVKEIISIKWPNLIPSHQTQNQ